MRRKRSTSTENIVRARMVSLQAAQQSDSGIYNCTAVNGGSFTSRNVLTLFGGALATTTTLEVRVQGTCCNALLWLLLHLLVLSLGIIGPVDVVQYLRFSVISFIRINNTLQAFKGDIDELPGVFDSLVS